MLHLTVGLASVFDLENLRLISYLWSLIVILISCFAAAWLPPCSNFWI
jgi:hypothetical protein